jgi:hypothetical protein
VVDVDVLLTGAERLERVTLRREILALVETRAYR